MVDAGLALNSRNKENIDFSRSAQAQSPHDDRSSLSELFITRGMATVTDRRDHLGSAGPGSIPALALRALPDRLLPLRDVIEFTGLGKTTIYGLMRKNQFPHAYKPGGHASRWSERELLEWRSVLAGKRKPFPAPH